MEVTLLMPNMKERAKSAHRRFAERRAEWPTCDKMLTLNLNWGDASLSNSEIPRTPIRLAELKRLTKARVINRVGK